MIHKRPIVPILILTCGLFPDWPCLIFYRKARARVNKSGKLLKK
jgi:hypothetical protein